MLRFFPLLFFIAVLPNLALAQEGCESGPVPVYVTPVFEEPKYDFTASIPDIQRLVADNEHSIHETLALGVTHYESILEFRTPVLTTTFPDGMSCTKIQRVDVTIGYKNVTVYIAREIPEGTCGFNEVMAHEQKHIAVNQKILQEYATRIQGGLADYFENNGMLRSRDHAKDVEALHQSLQIMLNAMGQRMIDDNQARQQDVDSRAEYLRLSLVCEGELTRAAGRYVFGRVFGSQP